MRISTSTIFNSGVYGMQQLQAGINHTQQQLSSGNRIITPADDPVAAAQALEVGQANSINTQYQANQNAANTRMTLNENALQSVTTLIQGVQSLVVSAGNSSITNTDRTAIASQLSGDLQQLVGLANSTDGTGVYLFAGGMGNAAPFQNTASGVQYVGDQSTQHMQISPSEQIQVSLSGADVFQNIRTGNGSFVVQGATSNSGSATVNSSQVTNQTDWNASSKNFSIKFNVSGGGTSYDVIDNSTGTTVLSAQPYTAGNAISLGPTSGASVTISGSPGNGDTFNITASQNQSVFTTIGNLITALNTSVTGPGSQAALTNSLSNATQNLANALSNVLTVRAANGSRLNEVTTAQSDSSSLGLQYQSRLATLTSVDYTAAISKLNQQTLALTAAQKSFVQVSNLSLFNYM
ncbi:MAG: flagellar hook-associated protein FlgL [Burkholderiales bacterium]|nr:flagellar hook-associated protein FlgL [Burkholderiales bacterium]